MAQPQGSPTAPQSVIDAVVNVENRVADFIANGPDTGIGGYVRDRYRDRCNEYANAPGWAKVLANGPTGSLNRLCTPYFDQQGVSGPVVAAPFTGGQCPVNYQVFRTTTNGSTGVRNPETSIGTGRGPFELRTNPNPDQTCPAAGGTLTNEILFATGNNVTLSAINSCTAFPISPSYRFVRVDGLPDDCGNPEPELRPGPNPPDYPGPQPGPEPTEDPRNPTGPPLLPIPPYMDPVGGPTPVVAPEDNPGGTGEPVAPVNPENGPGDPDAVGDPIPGTPGESGEGEDVALGPPPEGRAWVGCYVQVDVPGEYGDIPGSRPGNAVFPRVVGNVSLIHGSSRSQAVQIRSEWTDIFRASPAQPVDGVRVNVLPSISYLVYPVSVPLCPESTCPPSVGEDPPST